MQNKPPISDDDNEMADLKLRPDEVSQREGCTLCRFLCVLLEYYHVIVTPPLLEHS